MRIRKDNKDLMENEILLIADVSDALAHPLRVKILKYIMTQNRAMKTVCTKDLVEEFGYAQATISQHMKKLVLSGLVESKHKEKFNYYYVNLGLLARYVNAAKKFSVD
jgi:DNA-binding transcriptional ArsR family regulator